MPRHSDCNDLGTQRMVHCLEGNNSELLEEIGYVPPMLSEFSCYSDPRVVRHVYHAPLAVELNQLVLNEGWDMGLLTPEQIRQGRSYSAKAAQVMPLVPPTQQILLDFIAKGV